MIRISEIRLPLDTDFTSPESLCAALTGVSPEMITEAALSRRSVDARRRNSPCFICSFELKVGDEAHFLKCCHGVRAESFEIEEFHLPQPSARRKGERVLVAGLGPAGLFAALFLARAGMTVTVAERGDPVGIRRERVSRFFDTGRLDISSNIQFGEGGAGAFSDGKLTTGIKSPLCRVVLDELVKAGAPGEILYLAKPHIGTDRLPDVVQNIRNEIISLGGDVRFRTRLCGLSVSGGRITAATLETDGKENSEPFDRLILATGHSARDTFEMLLAAGVPMLAKPFAVGVRIEHPREYIDRLRYGTAAGHPDLGAADYKLVAHSAGRESVYTFCMCPGGTVVPAASEEKGVVTNGMSVFARDAENSNAALLVGTSISDFEDAGPLSGMYFQRRIEQAAFRAGGGEYRAPVQRVGDFLTGRKTTCTGGVRPSYARGVTPSSLEEYLPEKYCAALRAGLTELGKKLPGFELPDALLTGAETRSSSPVMLPRDESLMSGIRGLYPCGEGAGHAGGIVSAAVDGINAAVSVITGEDVK